MTNPVLYRLWRLRRLVLVALFLPVAAVPALAAFSDAAVTRPGIALPTLAATSLCLLALVLRFPRVPHEALLFSLSFALLILATPLYELLVAQYDGPLGGGHYVGLAFLLLLGWVPFLLVSAYMHDRLASMRPGRQTTLRLLHDTALAPKTAHAALRPSPDCKTAFSRSGPLAKDGSFPVWSDLCLPAALHPARTEAGPWAATPAPDYWLNVTDDGPLSFCVIARQPDDTICTAQYRIEPTATGSRIGKVETTNAFSAYLAFLFFLTDSDRDYMVAQLDSTQGLTPPRAIRLLPFRSLIQSIDKAVPTDDKPPLF